MMIEHVNEAKLNWSKNLLGTDTWDSRLYDLVINISEQIGVDDAVDLICQAARLKRFETTPESQKALEDLINAAKGKAGAMGPIA